MSFPPRPRPSSPPAAAQAAGERRLRKGYVRTMQIPEACTYRFVCDNENADFGIASTHVADTARNRQLVWGLTWPGPPAIGLITTATIAAVTFRRDRREKAAAPVPG